MFAQGIVSARVPPSASRTAGLGRCAAAALLREAGGRWRLAVNYARMEGLERILAFARDEGAMEVPGKAGLRPRTHGDAIGERLGLEDARNVSDILTRAAIPHAFTKGVANVRLYAEPGLRPFADLDVYVKPDDLSRAGFSLEKAGYEAICGNEMEIAYASPDPAPIGRSVDLHFLGSLPGQFGFDVAGAVGRAEFGDFPRLSPEDEVLSLASHMARNKFRGAGRSACDIAALAGSVHVDWVAVASRARDWGMRHAAWISIMTAREAFGAVVPDDAVAALSPGPARRAWFRIMLDPHLVSPLRLGWRSAKGPRGGISHFLLGPLLNDSHFRGISFTLGHALGRLAGRA